MDTMGTILGVLCLVAGLVGSGAYAVLSMADFRAARRGFWATAAIFAAIGLLLGIMTTWPLPIRMLVCAAFFSVASAGLVWVLDYLKVREAIGTPDPQPDIVVLAPPMNYYLVWDPPQQTFIVNGTLKDGKIPLEPTGETTPPFRVKNLGSVVAHNVRMHWEQTMDAQQLLAQINKSEMFKTYPPPISWDRPPDGKPTTFVVTATARNMHPYPPVAGEQIEDKNGKMRPLPKVMAEITFDVERTSP